MTNILLSVGAYDKPGGSNKVIRDLSERFSKDNFVLVLSNRLPEDDYEDRDINPNLRSNYFPKFSSNKYSLVHRVWKYCVMFKHILKNVREYNIDVIMCGEIDAMPYLLASFFSNAKVIIRGGNPLPHSLKNTFEKEGRTGFKDRVMLKLVDWYERTILYFSDGIIAMGDWEKEIFAKYTSKEVKVMNYGVDLKKFYQMNLGRKDELIYCGRQCKEKRTDLLNALANISGYKLNMFSNLPADEVPLVLNKHSIFVHASTDLGNAPLEAAACGLPVIVLGKFPEKYIICCEDDADFINKIKFYMENKKEYDKLVKKNLAYVRKNNNIDNIAQEYLKYIRQVIYNPDTCQTCQTCQMWEIDKRARWGDMYL
jgi:glycosyltransferase involved in cell wall biosynthesis